MDTERDRTLLEWHEEGLVWSSMSKVLSEYLSGKERDARAHLESGRPEGSEKRMTMQGSL